MTRRETTEGVVTKILKHKRHRWVYPLYLYAQRVCRICGQLQQWGPRRKS